MPQCLLVHFTDVGLNTPTLTNFIPGILKSPCLDTICPEKGLFFTLGPGKMGKKRGTREVCLGTIWPEKGPCFFT